MKNVFIYTDGGCCPNPGKGGYGTILICDGVRKELSGGFLDTTNNRMEVMAAIVGLEALKESCNVNIFSDSKYLVNTFEKGWLWNWKRKNFTLGNGKLRKNYDLWQRLVPLVSYHNVHFNWIKGHAGHVENERCDRIAFEATKMNNLPVDEYSTD